MKQSPVRLRSLDGLRGVAALIVVFHHLILSSRYGDVLLFGNYDLASRSPGWWLFRTPLAYAFAGTEAVIVFFVLSGFVLTVAALKPRYDWVAFSIRRVLRLWIPVAAAIILSAILVSVTNQQLVPGQSEWLQHKSIPSLDWKVLANSFDLLFGSTKLDDPLWTLRWELVFSLALPVFLGLGWILLRARFLGALVALSAVSLIGALYNVTPLWMLPAFLGGTVLAYSLKKDAPQLRPFGELVLGLLGFLILGGAVTLGIVSSHGEFDPALRPYLIWLFIPGSVLVVRASILVGPLVKLLSTKPIQFLGKISFSLYLIHAPVLIAVNHLIGHGLELWALPIALGASLLLATVFWRLIEVPSLAVAQSAGSWFSGVFARVSAENPLPRES